MDNIKKNKNIIILLLGALFIRLILASYGTLSLDQNTFIAWGRRAIEVGFGRFYDSWSDYLPGYIYVLWVLAKLEPIIGISTTILYKLPAIFADLATGSLIYFVLRKKRRLAMLSSAAFLFNPAVLANSTFWGQVDTITTLTALMSIVFINYWPLSSAVLAIGIAVKPQAIIATPIILALAIKNRWSLGKIAKYALVAGAVLLVLFLPFSGGNLFEFILSRFAATVDQYPYSSINAFNFWGLWGFWKEDSAGQVLNAKNIGALVLFLASLFSLVKYKLTAQKPYHFLAILFLTNFLFFTRMHERHMLPALAPLVIAAAGSPLLWFIYAGLSITYVANMYYSYQWITQDFLEVFPEVLVKMAIAANLFLFIALIKQILRPTKSVRLGRAVQFFRSIKLQKPQIMDRLSERQERILIILIVVFSITVRVFRLEIPQTDYFDEIYHAFTARQILAGDARPWHWSSAHPEGFAYEWTHPPLAKEIMAASMGILGVSSFAWRLPGAVAGTAMIFVVYLIAKKLFGSRDIAILAAFLIALDGLVLTMSRIGTADIFFIAFALTSYYLFLSKRDFSSAIFLGLAGATKWSTVWFLPIFFVTFVLLQRKLRRGLVWFLVIVPLVYLASYLPMFTFGHDLTTFWGMQKQMWWYHSGLTATHPYTSPWWSWPLMLRPVYLYQNYVSGVVANIYAIGNPFFFWFGALSVLSSIYLFIRQRTTGLAILIFGYFVLFVPWAASPRIMFLYHYLPSLPFVAILLGYCFKKYKWTLLPGVGLVVVAFVYFFPHWTGIAVPEWFDKTYYWFSSWR